MQDFDTFFFFFTNVLVFFFLFCANLLIISFPMFSSCFSRKSSEFTQFKGIILLLIKTLEMITVQKNINDYFNMMLHKSINL